MYEGISKSSKTEFVTNYILTIIIFHRFPIQSSPPPVHAMDLVFLLLGEAPLALTFCSRVQDGQQLFLNFRGVLEPMPL
jgi:hypothetical protein